MSETAAEFKQPEIMRLLRAHAHRLANPDTELHAMGEVYREICKATGERDRALRLFLNALNFYDGILLGFDWGWRAGRWMRPKKIPIVDRIAIKMLMKRPNLTNQTLVKRLDLQEVKLSDKLSPRNKREVKRLLGDDEVVWLWKRALQKKTRIHSVEVALADFRVEARQYADALWWHKVVIKYYRAHGPLDWARRAAVIKAQAAKEHSKQ